VQQLKLPELTQERIELLSSTAENAVGKHVVSKFPSKNVERPHVSVEAEGSKPLNLSMDVYLELATQERAADGKISADEAIGAAFETAEKCSRALR